MLRLRVLFFATVPLLASCPLMAATFAVGTCKPKLTSFSTISAAVSTVPAGSNVQVCPGTYSEQVTIKQPLNLEGIAINNQDQVVIAVPGTGLTTSLTSFFTQAVAAQVLVQAAGTVNLTNITVDGTGGDQLCTTSGIWLAGIFYASGSSGTVNRVRASGQSDEGCGVGVWAENGGITNQSVAVLNSSIHDNDGAGIFAGSGAAPTLTVTIRNNFISSPLGLIGVDLNSVSGAVTDNMVSAAEAGVFDVAPGVSVADNTATNAAYGVLLLAGGTVQSNELSNVTYGVFLDSDGATIQNNRITLATTAALELNCFSGTVSHNTINDAAVGIDQAPLGFNQSNTFNNTSVVSANGCAAALASVPLAASRSIVSSGTSAPRQWRTPATPNGVRQ